MHPLQAQKSAASQQVASPFFIHANLSKPAFQLELPGICTPSRLNTFSQSIKSLPQPPALWRTFERAIQKEASNQTLGSILEDDPVLAAAILRIANAPGLGLRQPIYDIGRAITHLGTTLVRTIVSRHAFSGVLPEGKVYDIPKLWKHGMAVAALAEIIGESIPNCNAEEAGTLGLFHDIGKMTMNLFTQFRVPATLDESKGHLVYEFEQFSCTHIDMGIALAEHWQLPDKIIQGIIYHHHPAYAEPDAIPANIRAEVFAVYLADMLATHLKLDTGVASVVAPLDAYKTMLPNITLDEILEKPQLKKEIERVQQVTF